MSSIYGCHCTQLPESPAMFTLSTNFYISFQNNPWTKSAQHVHNKQHIRALVNELLEFKKGIMICTPKYPKGRKVMVKLAALIDDVVATHKVAGFMSHSANSFCTWCDITINQKKELKLGRCQSGQDVCNTSFAYHELESHTKKEKLAKKTGIRWSELNHLP
ncbi:hypothetical protein O181_105563 [Austropuccinia psidii MF-1]|uniref:Uncharacterized protein n=1 Tax=Austropuccinia psidii MF-1 TaxID=1389203 RepID=A0A9Q3PL44_9BASI|nr:hypothetical protein [Austropuccinia psidii MF-1]